MPESSNVLSLEQARQELEKSKPAPRKKVVSLAEAKGGKPSKPASSLGARIGADVAGVADLPLSIPGMAASVLGDVGGRLGTLAAGGSRKEAAKEGARVGQEFAEPLMSPVSKVMKHFGYGEDYEKSDVTKALTTFSGWISHGAQWIEDHTHGAILKEDAQLLTNAIMTGGPVELAKGIIKAKPKPKPTPEIKPGTADFMDKMDEETKKLEEESKASTKGMEVKELTPEEANKLLTKPSVERTTTEQSKVDDWIKNETAEFKDPSDAPVVDNSSAPGPKGAASMEAIKRLGREKQQGVARVKVDARTGVSTPLVTVDAVDTFPQPHELIVKHHPDGKIEVLDKGAEVKNVEGPIERYKLRNKQGGQADPRLLAKIAGIAGGAAVGAYLADKDNKVEGVAAGMVGGLALATFAGRVFPKLDPEPGLNAERLSGSLERLVGQYKANQIQLLNFAAAFKKSVPDYQEHAEEIYHALEDPKAKLSPRAQEIKEKWIEPFLRQNAALRAKLKAEGVDVGEDVDSYVHRIAKGKPSIFEQLEKGSPQGKTFSHFAPPLEERTVFSIKDSVTGAKLVAVKDPTGTGFKVYQGKKIVGAGKVKPSEWESGDISFEGKVWKRGQATTKEIESQTNIEYHHDALAASISANARLTKALNNVKFVNALLKSKDASKIAAKRNASADWQEVPQIPQLRGWKFEPRTANVLEDFAATPGGDLTEGFGKISRFLTGSMFWNPLPHIFNVLDHSIVQRGLVSGWMNPAAYPRLMRTTLRAAKAVTERNEDYQRFIKEGGGLMYPNVLLQNFSQKILEQLGHREEMGAVAKAWGYANPLEMTKRIYAFSRKNLWAANDILMMQAYLEKEMIRPESVIKNVEKHIPNYRIPDQVMGSRMLSQMLRSPIALAFGRYDYGRMRSYGEMVKDALGKDSTLKDRGKALDQIAMLTVMGALIYPLVMDEGAKALTGDETATAQRFGASTIPWLVYQYLHKQKSASQVVGSSFPMGMALKSAVELSSNRDLFTGKHLIEDPKDIPSYLLRQLQPLGTAAKVQSGQLTPEQIAAGAVGIRIPSKKKKEHIQ